MRTIVGTKTSYLCVVLDVKPSLGGCQSLPIPSLFPQSFVILQDAEVCAYDLI